MTKTLMQDSLPSSSVLLSNSDELSEESEELVSSFTFIKILFLKLFNESINCPKLVIFFYHMYFVFFPIDHY